MDTKGSKLGKPGLLDAVVEDVDTVLVQDVCGAKMCNHMEECILLFV